VWWELGQADISVIKKAELKDRLSTIRKTFDKQIREREMAVQKKAIEGIQQHFQDDKKSEAYVAILDVKGNSKILQSVLTHGKKLGKAVYVFSVDEEAAKVAHANYIPPPMQAKGLDARAWSSVVVRVLGGKAGGKEDSAQGVGIDVFKVGEAVVAAKEYLTSIP